MSRTTASNRKLVRSMGKSLYFNGSNSYATCPIIPNTTGFSLAFWLKAGNIRDAIVNWQTANGEDGFKIYLTAANNNLGVRTYQDAATVVALDTAVGSFPAGMWKHVVLCVYPNNTKLYVDSVLIGTDVVNQITTCTNTMTLMMRSFAATNRSSGHLAEFVFQNTTTIWTQDQIDDLFYRGIKPTGASWYSFNDTPNDQSANGQDITVSNTAYASVVPVTTRSAITSSRPNLGFDLTNKTVLDTFAADGWTKAGTGTTGTWSVDSTVQYAGRDTLKLVTAGAGSGSKDFATKSITATLDLNKHQVFELIAKVNDVNRIVRFYLDIFAGSNYYNIVFEGTGNKWGLNNEFDVYRGTLHQNRNTVVNWSGAVTSVRLQISDAGNPITFNFAELSVYSMTKKAYVIITNDDGNKSAYDFQQNVMKPLGLTGTFFPSSENVAAGQGGNANYMNHANLLQMEADGNEIGIHGTSGTVTLTAATISFDAATKKILDSGDGLVTAGFKIGQFVSVTSSTSNNGKYTAVDVAAGYIQVSETLVDEAAGSNKTLEAAGFSAYGSYAETLAYLNTQITYLRDTAGVSSPLDIVAYPNGEYGKDGSSHPYKAVSDTFRLARGTHNLTESLVPYDLKRIGVGKNMYMQSVNTPATMMNAISNLAYLGGIGIILSHNLLEAATDTYNYNLTDATTVMTHIADLQSKGLLQVIKFSEIDNISVRESV